MVISGDSVAPTRSRANTATIPDTVTDSDDETLKAQKVIAKQRMKQAAKAAAPDAEISSDSDEGSAKTKAPKTAKATKTKSTRATKGKAAVTARAKTTQPDAENSSGEDNDEAPRGSKPMKSAPVGKGKKAVGLTPVPEEAPATRKGKLDALDTQPPPPSKAPAQKIQPRPIKKPHVDAVAAIPPQTDVTATKTPVVLDGGKKIPQHGPAAIDVTATITPVVLDGAERIPRQGMPTPAAADLTRQSQHSNGRAPSPNRQEGDQVAPPTHEHPHAPSNPSHAARSAPPMSSRPPVPVSSRPPVPVSSRPPVPNLSTRPPIPPTSTRPPAPHAASQPNIAPKRSAEGDVDMAAPKRLRNNSGLATARDSPPAEECYNGPPGRFPPRQ